MSTGTKRTLADAVRAAAEFRSMFDDTFDRWEVVGSVRRGRPAITDIDHVVIPRAGSVAQDTIFGPGESQTVNLLWQQADQLADLGMIDRAVYPDGRQRWGQKYLGATFAGFRHEIRCADIFNWGPFLAIYTGPADLSKRLVTGLLHRGIFRQQDGYVRYARGKAEGTIYGCPDERTYFDICGVPWLEPHQRD